MANEDNAIIPKTIHYCWFGRSEFPPLVKACMESWKVYLSDWNFVLWNEDNVPQELVFARKLLDQKLYAFASDYIRLYAIWKNGGIYLDVDMEVIRPLDALLCHRQFIAYEKEKRCTNAVSGGVPGAEFFYACLQEMDRHYSQTTLPVLSPELCTSVVNKHVFSDLMIYPAHVFYPYNPYDKTRPVDQLMYRDIQPDTLAIHHWSKSWRLSLFRRIARKLMMIMISRKQS